MGKGTSPVEVLRATGDGADAVSESGEATMAVMSEGSWAEKVAATAKSGSELASEIRAAGHEFKIAILAPRAMRGGEKTPLSAAVMELDWTIATRLEMVESARDMITSAYLIDSLDPAFPTVLASIIEGKGLYEHGVGEFFVLYGRFEERYSVFEQRAAKRKMMELVAGDRQHLRAYIERGKESLVPLPYAVRNILAHAGRNPNTLDSKGSELRAAIRLLWEWLEPQAR